MLVRFVTIAVAVALGPSTNAAAPKVAAASSIALKRLTLAELMDIEVSTVSRHREKLSESPAAVRVITGDEIRRSGATLIPHALRLAANLQVAQVNSGYWTIGSRGFNTPTSTSNKLLVMIDGRSIYTPLFSGTYWDSRDVFLPDVDRIEVISGPGGAMWGANAVNGVISIITRRASETQGGLVYGGAGNEERIGGFRYGGELGRAGHYRVYARHTDLDGTLRPDGSDSRDRWVFSQAGFRADWSFRNEIDATLQGDLYTGWIKVPTTSRGEYDGGNLLGRLRKPFAHGGTLTVQAYHDLARRGAPATFADRLAQTDIDAQYDTSFGPHRLTFGVNHRTSRDRVRNLPTQAFIPADFTHRLYSAFAHAEVELNPVLRASLGAKFEDNNYTGSDVLPSARITWLASSRQTVWGAISRAVRTPSRLERDLFIPPTPPFTAAGGPNFDSEELWAYELGWRGYIAEDASISLAGFVHDYDDLRTLELPVPLVFANGLEARTYGASVFFRHEPFRDFNWSLGYTQLKKDFELKAWSRDLNRGLIEQADPEYQLHLRAALNVGDAWEIDAGLRHVDDVPVFAAQTQTRIPAYTELDVRIGWIVRDDLQLSLVGRNLLDSAHPETGAPANRREIQRSLLGRVTWRF